VTILEASPSAAGTTTAPCTAAARPAPARRHHRRRLPPGRGRVLDVAGVRVAFGAVQALDGVTLAVREGAFVGLIGPNGAGKTTFFNVLSGFVKPSAGSVRAFDEDLLAMTDFRRARWDDQSNRRIQACNQLALRFRKRRLILRAPQNCQNLIAH